MYLNPSARTWRSQYTIDPAVLDFHKKLPRYAATPLRALPHAICAELGIRGIYLKDESARFGLPAFKILGASWACFRVVTRALGLSSTASLQEVEAAALRKDIRLYAATDGNYGRAVAHMARILGAKADICVPKIMLRETKRLISCEGASVHVVDGDYDAAVRAAEQGSINAGGLLVQDDAWEGYEEIPQWVVDGYSTMMLEIDRQIYEAVGRNPDIIIVPVGVGSLAQATVVHFKDKERSPIVLTVEPDTAACLKTSLEKGRKTTVSTEDTSMCGMNCGTVSSLSWPLLRDGVDASIAVTDAEANQALHMLSESDIRTGPCSAGTLAALTKVCSLGRHQLLLDDSSVVVLLGTEGPR